MNVIGIDIGGTGIKGMVISNDRTVLDMVEVETAIHKGRDGITASLMSVIERLLKKPNIDYIGVGTAGRVNAISGEVVYATDNLPDWQGTNIKEVIESKYRLPCVVENDANVALVGELWVGESYQNAVMLTLGTGVGGANVMNGSLASGAHHQGGEWGHVILVPFGRPCNCGQLGCIEQYLSGSALLKEVNSVVKTPFQHGREIFEKCSNQKEEAINLVVNQYLDYLALACYNLSVSIDPEVVIIGGGVIDSKIYWWDLFLEKLAKYQSPINVVPAVLGNKAGMYGAAKLAMDAAKKRGILL
ncbi:ROK family protein [Bacillus sp. DJP31]|uniref:ROK family protein n=1 Tax=Bacillus sp. DJP31 TaxID=3409789 RepID=UPI003BB5EC9C